MASNTPAQNTRVISLLAADFDRAHGWIEGTITVLSDLAAEAQSAIDSGDPLDPARVRDYLLDLKSCACARFDPARVRDYLRIAAGILRSASLILDDARVDAAADLERRL